MDSIVGLVIIDMCILTIFIRSRLRLNVKFIVKKENICPSILMYVNGFF